MSYIQSKTDLEKWNEKFDPWGYESNPEDKKRKGILLSEIPDRAFNRVLDIGCGHGFITRDLPGEKVIGVDFSSNAIRHAKQWENERLSFIEGSIFQLNQVLAGQEFDLILITGVLYQQYIGKASLLIYDIIDKALAENGILISVHISEWYSCRFPYLLCSEYYYPYREYIHKLEVYAK